MFVKITRIDCDFCGERLAEIYETTNKQDVLRQARRINKNIVVSHGKQFCNRFCWYEYQQSVERKK